MTKNIQEQLTIAYGKWIARAIKKRRETVETVRQFEEKDLALFALFALLKWQKWQN